jgi:rod shape-determining protein MreC
MNRTRVGSAKQRLPLIVLVFLTLLSGVFLAVNTGSFILNFKALGFSSLSVAEKGIHAVVSFVSSTVTAASKIGEIRSEYESLSREFANMAELQRSNAEIREENERLKEQLDFSRSYAYKNYPANVITRDPDPLYPSLTINKGSAQGIRKNMPVIAIQQGAVGLVGRIVSVGRQTSVIMPIYNSRYNVSSRIRTTRDVGLVSGSGSPDMPLMMSYIKKTAATDLQFGDIVETSGENGNYLRDIPLGRISRVTLVEYDASLAIELTPILDFSKLETVLAVDTLAMEGEEY